MTAKSVISVEIEGSQWDAHVKAFKKYQSDLAQTKFQWGAIGKTINSAATSSKQLWGNIKAVKNDFAAIQTSTGKIVVGLKAADRTVSALARGTLAVARNLKDATLSLLKWGSLTSLFSGLLGAGGLFGISRMAQSVTSGQSQSQRTGSTYGETKAAEAAYGNVINVQSVLEKINQARLSGGMIDGNPIFQKLGMKNWQNKSSAEILPEFLAASKRMFADLQKSTGGRAGLATGGMGLESILGLGEYTQLQKTDLDQKKQIYAANKRQLDLSESTQNAWVRFTQQLQIAGDMIHKVFATSLVGLAGPLGELSKSLAKAVGIVMNSKFVKAGITGAGKGLETFANYLSGEQFPKDFQKLMDGLAKFGDAMMNAAEFINKWLAPAPSDKTLAEQLKSQQDFARSISQSATMPADYNSFRPSQNSLKANNSRLDVFVHQRDGADTFISAYAASVPTGH